MATTITTFRELCYEKIKDTSSVLGTWVNNTSTIYDDDIAEAVKIYSKRRPNIECSSETGTANTYHAMPTNWEEDFSHIINIEYPVLEDPPEYIQENYWRIEHLSDGILYIRFISSTYPGNGDTFYVRFTKRHSVSASASTIPVAHEEAVTDLACYRLCMKLAQYYTQSADSSIGADAINYTSKADEYRQQSEKFKKAFNDIVKPLKTGSFVDWDMNLYWEVEPLTHSRDYN